MKRERGPFALRRPDGSIAWETIAATKADAWVRAFPTMPPAFRDRYWKRWNASIAAAKRAGYSFVPVDVIARETGREREMAQAYEPPERTRCPHGEPVGECHACDVAGDFAFDAAREARIFGR